MNKEERRSRDKFMLSEREIGGDGKRGERKEKNRGREGEKNFPPSHVRRSGEVENKRRNFPLHKREKGERYFLAHNRNLKNKMLIISLNPYS